VCQIVPKSFPNGQGNSLQTQRRRADSNRRLEVLQFPSAVLFGRLQPLVGLRQTLPLCGGIRPIRPPATSAELHHSSAICAQNVPTPPEFSWAASPSPIELGSVDDPGGGLCGIISGSSFADVVPWLQDEMTPSRAVKTNGRPRQRREHP